MYTGISKQLIPYNYFYYPQNVGSTPLNYTLECPPAYAPKISNLSTIWTSSCYDGFRNYRETWDNKNANKGEGWLSGCLKIESGWIWYGGSTTTVDTWKEWSVWYEPSNNMDKWIISAYPDNVLSLLTLFYTLLLIHVIGNSLSVNANQSSTPTIFLHIYSVQHIIILSELGAYIPLYAKSFIRGLGPLLFSFSFIKINNIPIIDYLYDAFDFQQQDDFLYLIGFESGSTFINLLKIFLLFLFITLLHVILLLIIKLMLKFKRLKFCFNFMLNIIKKWLPQIIEATVYYTWTSLGFYLQLFFLTQVYILIWVFSEIFSFSSQFDQSNYSLPITFIVLFVYCILLLVFFCNWLKIHNNLYVFRIRYLKGLFQGLKSSSIVFLLNIAQWIYKR